ncbi:hypothetical protein O0I10_010666 [Lichtheimia ornata]|uniref:RING-type domain-containing protein n=1 Tax=Lichtheimia ornata TaxID=688661 RepID=A0AAD7XR29_9FUNG|nr:uncharacterized protein O0I10_010666 [Lichtheimia ornata]KAJ8653629.1 hypothetical protein O0I10_010666 [Lichtheimia ornata]
MGQNFSTTSNSHDPSRHMSEQRNDTNNASSSTASSPRRTLSRSASARQVNRYNPLSRSTRPIRTSSSQSLPLNASSLLSPNEEDPPPPSGMVTRSRAAAAAAAALAAGGQQQQRRRRDVDNVPYSLRRSVRMSRMRDEQQQQEESSSSMMDIDQPQQQPDASTTNNDPAHTLLAPSMIADVITQAVLSAFRDRHTGAGEGNTTETTTTNPDPMMTTTAAAAAAAASATTTTTTTTGEGGEQSLGPEQLSSLASMHIPSMLNQTSNGGSSSSPSTGASTDESFFRYVRLPVMLTTVSANGETQQLREMTMPMVIVGYRIRGTATTTTTTPTPNEGGDDEGQQQGLRRSQRIAAQRQQQRQQQEEEEQQRNASSRWMVWIYSDTTGEGGGTLPGLSESPTYEELLSLVESLGPARFPISIEQIDASAPTQQYNAQVAASMVGDTENCHVCLEKFVALDVVRVLKCQHGFHQTCIDKWLTEGQNRCPLCRAVPVERTPNNTTSTTSTTTPSAEASSH